MLLNLVNVELYLRISIHIMSLLRNYCQWKFLKLQAAPCGSVTLQTTCAISDIHCFKYSQKLQINGIKAKDITEYIFNLYNWDCEHVFSEYECE